MRASACRAARLDVFDPWLLFLTRGQRAKRRGRRRPSTVPTKSGTLGSCAMRRAAKAANCVAPNAAHVAEEQQRLPPRWQP
eukprot:2922044-Pyramimonas_sp.AAC.1